METITEYLKRIGAKGGSSRSASKIAACQMNAKKGGRPRKQPAQPIAAPQETPANPPKTEEHAPERPMSPASTKEPVKPKETPPLHRQMGVSPDLHKQLPTIGSQVQTLRRF